MTNKTEKVKEGQLVGKKERIKMGWQPDINQRLGGRRMKTTDFHRCKEKK